jgi:hypothetical protein
MQLLRLFSFWRLFGFLIVYWIAPLIDISRCLPLDVGAGNGIFKRVSAVELFFKISQRSDALIVTGIDLPAAIAAFIAP